jgi:hypothetical protein
MGSPQPTPSRVDSAATCAPQRGVSPRCACAIPCAIAHPEAVPQGTPEALPSPILRRLSSTSQSVRRRAPPSCEPLRRAAAAHWGRGKPPAGVLGGAPAEAAPKGRLNFLFAISPAHSAAEHAALYTTPPCPSTVVIYSGFGFKGHNVISVWSADIVILVTGGIGTLNECTIAYDEGKVIGLL